jgi:hypothetical protein
MRGVVIHPDGIETLELLALGFPKVRKLDWAMIDRFRFDAGKGMIGIDLWDGQQTFLPPVAAREELVQSLTEVAEARAIPYTGAPDIDGGGTPYRARTARGSSR